MSVEFLTRALSAIGISARCSHAIFRQRWFALMVRNALLVSVLYHLPVIAAGLDDWVEDPLRIQPSRTSAGPASSQNLPVVCPPQIHLGQPLALSEAIDWTLCNNPQIQTAWLSIKVQASAVGEANAAYLPTLSASRSRLNNKVNYPDNPSSDANEWGNTSYAAFNWRIFDFGGRQANLRANHFLLTAALATHDAALQKALVTVIGSYFEVLTTSATAKAKSQSERIAKEVWESTVRKEASRAAPQYEVLQADAQYAKAQMAAKRAQGDHQKATSNLAYVMGLDAQTELVLQEPLDERDGVGEERTTSNARARSSKDLQTWLEETKARHPAIAAAKAQWEAAKMKAQSVKLEGLPTIDFVSNRYKNGYPNQGLQATQSQTTTWGVTMTIPLFEGFARTYKIRGAQALAEQNEAQLKEVQLQTLTEVVKSFADTQSSFANLALSQRMLEASQLAFESSLNRFKHNAADIFEMFQAQETLAQAEQERIRCLAEWRVARLRLLANAGQLRHGDL